MTFPKTATLLVKAVKHPCPMLRTRILTDKDGNDLTVIKSEPVEVPNVRYYRRRVEAGDLELVVSAPVAAKKVKE